MKFGPFLGENNRLRDHELHIPGRDGGDYLASTNNVVIDDTRRIESRGGYTKVASTTTGRSLATVAGKTLFADGTNLKRVSFDPLATTTIDTVGTGRVCYADVNGEVYYSDGEKLSCLQANDTVRPVGVPVPAAPTASLIAGSLIPAWYQVTITYLIDGEEGGAYPSLNVEATTGGIRLTLPAAPADVTHVAIYMSGPNGEIPMRHSTVVPATVTVDLTTPATGRGLRTQLKGPMPAGELIARLPNYLLVADGSVLYYSDEYNFGMTTPEKNYLPFQSDISVLVAFDTGAYVVADKTYWLTGLGTPAFDLITLLPHGAVRFSQSMHPTEKKCFWLSERGLVTGDDAAQVKNLQEDALKLSLSGNGASLFVDGMKRVVATGG